MAAISYAIGIGGNLETVVAATNSPAAAGTVEIRIDQTATSVTDAAFPSGRAPHKGEIQALIRVLEQYLIRDTNVLEP